MRQLALALAVTLGAILVGPGTAGARSCSVSVDRYSATAYCVDADESYRECIRSNYYVTYCGPWRPGDFSASIAAVPCCTSGQYRITQWTEWKPR